MATHPSSNVLVPAIRLQQESRGPVRSYSSVTASAQNVDARHLADPQGVSDQRVSTR